MEHLCVYRASVRGTCGLKSFWDGRKFYVQCEVSILSHLTVLAVTHKIRNISEIITEIFLN